MIDKKKLLKDLEEGFEDSKKELGFKPNFEELDLEFSLKDSVLSSGFVSEDFSKQLCSRIVEHYRGWHDYLNGLLLPNPSYYAGQTESKLFNSKEDRKKIWNLIKISMEFSSMYSLVSLKEDKSMQMQFINKAYTSWVGLFKPGILYVLTKVNEGWKEK